jgi:methyl-accepting chemotaxis protein
LAVKVVERQVMALKINQVHQQSQIAVSVVAQYQALAESGSLTNSQAQARAAEALERLRYDGENYFWALTSDHTLRAHGSNRALRGQNMAEVADTDGVYMYREMVTNLEGNSYGVVRYRWPAAGAEQDSEPFDKLSVVVMYEPWGWIIGTGIYLDDVDEALADLRTQLAWISAAIALIMGLVASVLGWSIVRPISRLTGRMDALTAGDTESPVPYGTDKTTFGKISAAVESFRMSLIESNNMRAQEIARQQEVRARDEKQADDARERALAEERAKHEAAAHKRALEDKARAESEAMEEEARQEREARAQEQQKIFSTLADALTAFAQGDLKVRISTPFPDAYESLRENFNRTVAGLESVMDQVAKSGEQVGASSSEISTAATDIAKQTEQVSAAIEGTSAAVTELTSSAKMASAAASDANALMVLTQQNANKSRTVTKSAVGTMGKINDSSNAISKVVDLIEAIAFQTNLLALNAGVEAARAGENGRGFAVVAMEVRALAQRSSDAVQEINGFIVESRADVEAGVKEVSAAGEAIEGVIAQITEASAQMAQIVQTVTEQSVALCDIEAAVSDIDRAMQRNAAAFEETASVGIELSNEAQRLNELMAGFKLEKVARRDPKADTKAA